MTCTINCVVTLITFTAVKVSETTMSSYLVIVYPDSWHTTTTTLSTPPPPLLPTSTQGPTLAQLSWVSIDIKM